MTELDSFDDVLAHFGIRGMKWGVRRERGSDGRVSGSAPSEFKPTITDDAAKALQYKRQASTHGSHTLSNAELQHLVNRINLEKKYIEVAGAPQKKKARKYVKKLLTKNADSAVNQIATAVTAAQVAKFLAGSSKVAKLAKAP